VVATANPGCTLQIASIAAEMNKPLRVVHPIELIDASIRGIEGPD
jgi:Fe-S oxidoreductase